MGIQALGMGLGALIVELGVNRRSLPATIFRGLFRHRSNMP